MTHSDHPKGRDVDRDSENRVDSPAEETKERRAKPLSPHYKCDNSGGYGNPPQIHQFQEGNKGGPGRPKGVTNLESAMRKVIGTRITVNKQGKSTKMLPVEVYSEKTVESLLTNTKSPKMLEPGHQFFEKYGPKDPAGAELHDYSLLSYDELVILGALIDKALGRPAPPPERSPLGPFYDYDVADIYRVFRGADGCIHVQRTSDESGENPSDCQ